MHIIRSKSGAGKPPGDRPRIIDCGALVVVAAADRNEHDDCDDVCAGSDDGTAIHACPTNPPS